MWCVFWLGHGLVRFCLMMSGTYGNGVVSCNEVWIRNGVVGIRCGEVMVWERPVGSRCVMVQYSLAKV